MTDAAALLDRQIEAHRASKFLLEQGRLELYAKLRATGMGTTGGAA